MAEREQLRSTYPAETRISPCLHFSAIPHGRSLVQQASWSPHRGQEWKVQEVSPFGLHPSLDGTHGLCWGADVADSSESLWVTNQGCCTVAFFLGLKQLKFGYFVLP